MKHWSSEGREQNLCIYIDFHRDEKQKKNLAEFFETFPVNFWMKWQWLHS